jgi:copper(I)-binding protein
MTAHTSRFAGLMLPAALAALVATGIALARPAHAQSASSATVTVEGAWARATVPGQKGTGAFMRITAKDGAQLVGASSSAAGVVEVHEMKMDGGVMRMRALPALDLPAGQPVELKPGGYHVMLMDLKSTLPKDSTVPLTLVFKDARGNDSRLELKVPVASAAPAGSVGSTGPGGMAAHKH